MEAKIRGIVGVVTVGLRARGADVILLGTDIGVKTLKPGR
jgi:ribose 5-phosphate isomerase